MQRSPSPAASACSSYTAGGSSRRSGEKSMQKAKRKTPQAFGGMAARNQESREDWQWAVAQIEQQMDQASLSNAAGLAAPSQQAREPSGSGAPSQPTLDKQLLPSAATPPRVPPAAACVSVFESVGCCATIRQLGLLGPALQGPRLRCGRSQRPSSDERSQCANECSHE